MRVTKRPSPFVLVPVVLLLFAACAAGTGRSRVQAPEVVLEVQNDLNPPRSVTIRLASQVGQRSLLGSLSPSQTQRFRHREAAYHGQYRLVAESGLQEDIVSTTFTLSPGARIVWRLQSNTIRTPSDGP